MARITSFGKVDTLTQYGEIAMPLVILKAQNISTTKYIGFIPGITTKDITSNNLDDCKKLLKEQTKKIITQMAKDNIEFPFFPTKEDILKDFKNVVEIIYIKIKSKKRNCEGNLWKLYL